MTPRVLHCVRPLGAAAGERRAEAIRAQERAMAAELLRRMGFDAVGVEIRHHADGRPYLPAYPGIGISISHSKDALAVALAEGARVGIDVESRRRPSASLMERVCNECELEAIRSSDDPAMAFLRLWTGKEAVLKMKGTGIRGFRSLVDALDEGYKVEWLELDDPDWVGALATDG